MKKKILSTVFVLSVCIMTACGNTKTETNTTTDTTVAETVTESEKETTPETDADVEETVAEPEETKETEPEETPVAEEPEETKDSKDDKKTPDKKDDKKREETKPAETKTDDKKDTGKNNGGNSGSGNGSGSGTTPANPGTTPKPTPVNPTPSPKPTPTPTPAVCSHTWDAGTVTVKATCSKEGTKTYTCTKCKETKTESIAKTNHDFELKQANELCHVETCQKMGCYAKQCKNCGYIETYVDTPMLFHNRDDVRRNEATCGQNGKVEYYCTMCHGKQGEEILPATGQHTWVTVVLQDWTWNESCEWYERILEEKCSVCGTGATGHQNGSWWVETKTD